MGESNAGMNIYAQVKVMKQFRCNVIIIISADINIQFYSLGIHASTFHLISDDVISNKIELMGDIIKDYN